MNTWTETEKERKINRAIEREKGEREGGRETDRFNVKEYKSLIEMDRCERY